MKQKDARIKLMNEVLNGIKVCTKSVENLVIKWHKSHAYLTFLIVNFQTTTSVMQMNMENFNKNCMLSTGVETVRLGVVLPR